MIVGCIADVGSILLTCLCFEFHIIGAAPFCPQLRAKAAAIGSVLANNAQAIRAN
jgi:hypothetical protein